MLPTFLLGYLIEAIFVPASPQIHAIKSSHLRLVSYTLHATKFIYLPIDQVCSD